MKSESTASNNKQKVFAVAGISFALVLILAIVGRGWIRSSGFGWYANTFVGQQVQKEYEKQLSEVNQELAEFGITNWSESTQYCGEPQYQGLGISGGCFIEAQSGIVADFDRFKSKWQKESQVFNEYMVANGWTNYVSNTQEVSKIFDTDPGVSTNDTGYTKTVNGVLCAVRIGYNPKDTEGRKVFVDEGCSKTVEIFGGY